MNRFGLTSAVDAGGGGHAFPKDYAGSQAVVKDGEQRPLRQHATFSESIKHIMDVFEQVKREQGRFVPRWAIDHAETIQDAELQPIRTSGGIAIQNRMAVAGKYSC